MKRQGLALLAVAVLIVTSGCVGLVLGDNLKMEADAAAVSDEAVGETEFAFSEYRTVYLNESFSVAGQKRNVNTTSHMAIYNRTVDLRAYEGETGAFAVVSTPDVRILGRSINPAARMSNQELVDEFKGELESQLGEMGNLTPVTHRTEPVLGYAANVTTFETTTTIDGEEVDLNIHVTKVRHDSNVIVAIGGHPEALQQQAPEIFTLMRGIEHPVDGEEIGN